MPGIDEFASTLLEEAKRYLEKATEQTDDDGMRANLHAALMLAFCSLEAHVNAICEEVAQWSNVSLHDIGVLTEKEVRLENGEFVVQGQRMIRLEDKIKFVLVRFGTPLDLSRPFWADLIEALRIRNALTHPKDSVEISEQSVGKAMRTIIATLSALYAAIYKKPFPDADIGLQSTLNF